MMNGKMYKILVPIERDGVTHWLRSGVAFTNKDESLNAYLDALPISVFTGGQLKLQIRELDAEELRRRDESRARRDSSGGVGGASGFGRDHHQPQLDKLPF